MTKPELWLLPGLLCDATVWQPQLRDLVHLADIRVAHFWGADSLTTMAEQILERAAPRIMVAAHSMGARVALEIMRLAPERVERLALLDTGTHPVRPGEAEKRGELVQLAAEKGMAALAATWLPPMVHPDRLTDAAFMQTLTDMVCRATPQVFAGQIKALLNRPDGGRILASISCPVLVGCGREDLWSPISQHEEIVARIPSARLTVFEHSGHMSTLEAPEAVTAALEGWVRES